MYDTYYSVNLNWAAQNLAGWTYLPYAFHYSQNHLPSAVKSPLNKEQK